MNLISRYIRSLQLSMLCSALSSGAILISMAEVDASEKLAVKIIASLLFWIGLIIEQALFWCAARMRKKIALNTAQKSVSGVPGVFGFCKTKVGTVADAIFVLSLIVYVVLAIGNWGTNAAQYIFLFLIVLSFRLHCIANGKNYRYKLYLQRRRAKS